MQSLNAMHAGMLYSVAHRKALYDTSTGGGGTSQFTNNSDFYPFLDRKHLCMLQAKSGRLVYLIDYLMDSVPA